MKRILLSQNQYTLVDNEDHEYLKHFNWCARYCKDVKSFYAVSNIKKDKKYYTTGIHRYIMSKFLRRDLTSKETVDHINHDTLDNTKENLRVVSNRVNQDNKSRGISGLKWITVRGNKYRVQMTIDKKIKKFGTYHSKLEACYKILEIVEELKYNNLEHYTENQIFIQEHLEYIKSCTSN